MQQQLIKDMRSLDQTALIKVQKEPEATRISSCCSSEITQVFFVDERGERKKPTTNKNVGRDPS